MVLRGSLLEPYKRALGTEDKAIEAYYWNARLSGGLLYHVHLFEVCLRNAVDRGMRTWRPDWLFQITKRNDGERPLMFQSRAKPGGLVPNPEAALAEKALKEVRRSIRKKSPGRRPAMDELVSRAGLTFWVGMLRGRYEKDFWLPHISRAFLNKNREEVQLEAEALLQLRHRIAHHEQIILNEHGAVRRFLELHHYKRRAARFVSWIDENVSTRMSDWCDFDSALERYLTLCRPESLEILDGKVVRRRPKDHFARVVLNGREGWIRCDRTDVGDFAFEQLAAGGSLQCLVDRRSSTERIVEVLSFVPQRFQNRSNIN